MKHVSWSMSELQTSASSDALTLPHSSSSALMVGAMPVACTYTNQKNNYKLQITMNAEYKKKFCLTEYYYCTS